MNKKEGNDKEGEKVGGMKKCVSRESRKMGRNKESR